jgi:hypothetical protein
MGIGCLGRFARNLFFVAGSFNRRLTQISRRDWTDAFGKSVFIEAKAWVIQWSVMRGALEYETIRPGLFFWQVYDPAVKTELCCCAFEAPEGLVFCDPVRLDGAALEELTRGRAPRAILLTNGNHERDAEALARRFRIEVWSRSGAGVEGAARRIFEDGEVLFGGVEAVAIEGFGPGETAFWFEGVLMVGDALIHAPPYGFSVLPDK